MNYYDDEREQVFSELEKADSIVIFGHKNPDGDCVGSVLGMKHALKTLFPTKKVYAVGSSRFSGFNSFIKFFMPPLSSWNTPSVFPVERDANTFLSS